MTSEEVKDQPRPEIHSQESAADLGKADVEQVKPVTGASKETAAETKGEAAPASPPSKTGEAGKVSRDAHAEESLSRKRDREGSVEPSSAASAVKSPSDVLPAKKNRLLGSVSDSREKAGEDDSTATVTAQDSQSAPKTETGDSEKVGQIRQRVEELSYDERETKRADLGEKRRSSDTEHASSGSSSTAGEVKKAADPAPAPAPPAPAAATPSRKQPTFSSFSASSSPFASSSASAGVSGPSWLAGSSGTGSSSSSSSSPSASSTFGGSKVARPSGGMSGTTGAIKPSTLGGESSPAVDETARASSSPAPASSSSRGAPSSSAAPPAKSSAGLGFGAFAASRPFTGGSKPSGSTPAAASGSSSASKQPDDAEAVKSPPAGESIFDQQQTTGDETGPGNEAVTEETENGDEGKSKVKVQSLTEAELATGEEHERTVHSVRAKLYTMSKDGEDGTSADGTWKERGTGTLRVNVPKDMRAQAQGGARLVMRAEGVFRLILNVALFKGMKVELAQDKFVRIVALEGGKLVHFAIKVSNPTAAFELFKAVKRHIPLASTPSGAGTNGSDRTAPPALPPRSSKATGFAFHARDEGGEEPRGDEAA